MIWERWRHRVQLFPVGCWDGVYLGNEFSKPIFSIRKARISSQVATGNEARSITSAWIVLQGGCPIFQRKEREMDPAIFREGWRYKYGQTWRICNPKT